MALRALADDDQAVVDSTLGQWVPQLSAKKSGLVVDGQSFDSAAVLQDHQRLRSSYTGVRLLRSGDYSTFSSPDFWITVVAEPYPSAEAANAWCDAQGLGGDDCFAKQLSHTAPPAGSTKHRPA